ncbi:hypothetical protein, partial [Candidatus Entotheonella palauensis]|uniref:hypothetical protein n=1 Tax=Candidatus Entotheonella palauensis TaxID=93172 RepID=UPI001C4DEA1D
MMTIGHDFIEPFLRMNLMTLHFFVDFGQVLDAWRRSCLQSQQMTQHILPGAFLLEPHLKLKVPSPI